MAKILQRTPYTLEYTFEPDTTYMFEVGENLTCEIEKIDDPTWRAKIEYVANTTPTVITYEKTGIETSNTPTKFSIYDTGRLVLHNNTTETLNMLITRIS